MNKDQTGGRHMTAQDLVKNREEYNARERDENGKVKVTKGRMFNFWGTKITDKNKAKAKSRKMKLAIERFRKIDTDGSNTVSKKEITAGAEVLGMTVTRAVEWFDLLNQEGGYGGEVPMDKFLEKYVDWIPEADEGAAFHVSNE